MTHPIREAVGRPSSNAIYPTDSQRSGAVEAIPQAQQRANGRAVRRAGWPAMEEVHGRRDATRDQSAYPVLRHGPAGVGSRDAATDLEPDARSRRDDRAGQRVIAAGPAAQAVDSAAQLKSESGHNSANSQGYSIPAIVREALRSAALAPTYQDALDVTGDALRRLAELAREGVAHG